MSSHITTLPPGPEDPLDIGFTDNALELLTDFRTEYGDIFKVYSPFRKSYTYVLCDPEAVKHVLVTNNKNYTKGVGLDRVKILLGNGIMVSEGEEWRRQRRMIQPAFHKQVIERFAKEMENANREVLERWLEAANSNQTVNITKETSRITLDIVLNSIFSGDLEKITDEHGINPFYLVHDNHHRDLQFALNFRKLSKVVQNLVDTRRAEKRREFDFLSMLMETTDKDTGEYMTDKQLMDEILTLIVAGHETTAASLNWVWYLLASDSNRQHKLYEETQYLKGSFPQFSKLDELNYTNQVIKEALRLFPPGWLLTRRAINEDLVQEYYVEPNTDIFIPIYLIHRDENYWPDGNAFNPERFENMSKEMPRFAYFPFAGGPRQCIGDFYALVEMTMNVAFISQHLRFELADKSPIELVPQINLRTKHDLFLKVFKR